MSAEMVNLILSITGLLLGLISAWQAIKALVLKAAEHGSDAARSWATKEKSLVELYLESPATLVAYLGKSVVSLFLFSTALLFVRPGPLQDVFGLSAGLAKVLSFVPACLIGLVLGSISSRCSAVVQLASKRKAVQPPADMRR